MKILVILLKISTIKIDEPENFSRRQPTVHFFLRFKSYSETSRKSKLFTCLFRVVYFFLVVFVLVFMPKVNRLKFTSKLKAQMQTRI